MQKRHGNVTDFRPKFQIKMDKKTSQKGFSFKLYQKLANNKYAVSLVLRYNGQRLLINLPFVATKKQWDKVNERYIDGNVAKEIIKKKKLSPIKKKEFLLALHPERETNNSFLDKKAVQILDIVSDYERRKIPFTNTMIKEQLFVTVNTTNVESFLLSHIEELKSSHRFGTATTFIDLHIRLKKFDCSFNKKIFPDIDYKYVCKFFDHLKIQGRELGGIGISMRTLRTLLNQAIKANIGSPETYPFSNQYGTRTGRDTFSISVKTKVITRKRYIPINYLKKFHEFDFESIPHQRSKGLFFFSFFCGGINFADMANLRKSDIKSGFNREGEPIKYFTYIRSKTKEFIEIQLNEDIQRQIEYLQNEEFGTPAENYLLPIIIKEGMSPIELNDYKTYKRKKLNKYLHQMAAIMDFPESIQDLSTYVARHSFAMRLFSKTKSIDIVSAGLHHSNTEVTKVYLESFGADEVARVSNGLLD